MFLWKTREEVDSALDADAFRGRLAEEMADIQTYLLSLAEVAGVSLSEAVQRKLKGCKRTRPARSSSRWRCARAKPGRFVCVVFSDLTVQRGA